MPANFFANTYTVKTAYDFSGGNTANLSFANTSNVSTNVFTHIEKVYAGNNKSTAVNIINRPVKGQLYPR